MAEAGVKTPLTLTMTLPPAPYARQGGELIAAQLAKIGIQLKLQNVEWAQWLSGTYTNKNYDLTIISHVEPFDLGNFAKPDYYWGYQSQEFNELSTRSSTHRALPTAHACLAMHSACWRMIRYTAFSTPRSG
jgi:peptide/nickel transport system substrate-binding protein